MDKAAPSARRTDGLCCFECDYSLRGLPARGRCPECGETYDLARIVVYGTRLDANHPLVTAALCLLLTGCCWSTGQWHIAATIASVIAIWTAYRIYRHIRQQRMALWTRMVFHTQGAVLEPPMANTVRFDWTGLRKCRLHGSRRLMLRPLKGRLGYRLRASESSLPMWLASNADVWFTTTPENAGAIAGMIRKAIGDRAAIRGIESMGDAEP